MTDWRFWRDSYRLHRNHGFGVFESIVGTWQLVRRGPEPR
jgi:hypothetical protein